MFNLQQCEISIYHQHNSRELERQKKGREERERSEGCMFLLRSPRAHGLNTNRNAALGPERKASVWVCAVFLSEPRMLPHLSRTAALGDPIFVFSHLLGKKVVQCLHLAAATLVPFFPPALYALETYIVWHRSDAWSTTAFMQIPPSYPFCKTDEIIPIKVHSAGDFSSFSTHRLGSCPSDHNNNKDMNK